MAVKLLHIVGARPNFMKAAPLLAEVTRSWKGARQVLVHTGQHFSPEMSDTFFADLALPKPDYHLGVGVGPGPDIAAASHEREGQVARLGRTMGLLEQVFVREAPSLIVTYGDVDSTLAAGLTASRLGMPFAHVEAGLRSGDRSMPEELNRIVVDALADLHFTTSRDAAENLLREGIPRRKVHTVGNLMVDTLLAHRASAEAESDILDHLGLADRSYGVFTLHRPANVDTKARLSGFLRALTDVAQKLPMVFVVHPRTAGRMQALGLERAASRWVNVVRTGPLGYHDFSKLIAHAKLVLTDSGGVQEETTALGIPCVTLRENTERPVTLSSGTNILAGTDPAHIVAAAHRLLARPSHRASRRPPLWDGHAAKRIVTILRRLSASSFR